MLHLAAMSAAVYDRTMQAERTGEVDICFLVRTQDDWTLTEGLVPVARTHELSADLAEAVLAHWARTVRPAAQVGKNLAVRWDRDRPAIGVDPDVYVVDPAPPEGDDVTSLRLWEPGHHAPLLAIEVVSPGHPVKDYAIAPLKYAVSGTTELWIFDPLLSGPAALGGPHRLQIWARDTSGALVRTYAGDGPALSPALGGWLVTTDEGKRLRVADDRDGVSLWPTSEEAERVAKEAALAARDREREEKEAERVAKEAALVRIAELEAALRGRG